MAVIAQMIQDMQTRLCWNSGTGQAVTTDAVSENVIKFGAAAGMIGMKGEVVHVLVKTAFAGMASGMNIQLRADTAASLASGSQIILAERSSVAVGDLAAGDHYQIAIPPTQLPASFQYMGLYFDLISEAATAGNIIAWIGNLGETVDAVD